MSSGWMRMKPASFFFQGTPTALEQDQHRNESLEIQFLTCSPHNRETPLGSNKLENRIKTVLPSCDSNLRWRLQGRNRALVRDRQQAYGSSCFDLVFPPLAEHLFHHFMERDPIIDAKALCLLIAPSGYNRSVSIQQCYRLRICKVELLRGLREFRWNYDRLRSHVAASFPC